jgi:outer membrane protein assembly factor BamB
MTAPSIASGCQTSREKVNVESEKLKAKMVRRAVLTVTVAAAIAAVGHTQGRSAPDWTTEGADAQRSSWISVDPWISLDTMSSFRFLWKLKLDNEPRQMNALTAPVSMANLNSFRGFKSLVFVGGSANNVYAIDYDFGTLFWKTHINYSSGVPEYAGSPSCPGGMTSGLTRSTSLSPMTQLPFMGFARPPRPAKGAVGEPGRGAPGLVSGGQSGGQAGAGRGGALPPAPASAAQAGRGGGANWIFAVGGDGIVRALNPLNGDAAPPVKWLPPNASASGLIQAGDMVYATTSNGCGSAPDAVWAIDWSRDEKPLTAWKSNGAPVEGLALGTDGTVYVTVGDGTSRYANSVVALEAKTLQLKDWFTEPGARFSSSPVVFSEGNRAYVAAAGSDGRLHLLNADALGGSDHQTPLVATAASGRTGFNALATWRDARGRRWLLSTTTSTGTGAIAAFTFAVKNGAPALEQAWTSRNLTRPRAPIIINGVVFALSSGRQSEPAVLYALNPDTGKEIWSSGSTITSFATAGLSAGTGQVYVVTYDNTVWSFGIPQAY